MHCNARHTPGKQLKKPSNRDLDELQYGGFLQSTAYKQKNSSTFCTASQLPFSYARRCRNLHPCCMSTSRTYLRERNRGTRQGIVRKAISATRHLSTFSINLVAIDRTYISVQKPCPTTMVYCRSREENEDNGGTHEDDRIVDVHNTSSEPGEVDPHEEAKEEPAKRRHLQSVSAGLEHATKLGVPL